MFSRRKHTAAWRLSALSGLAFAAGTALAFLVAYSALAKTVIHRGDAWLQAEANAMAAIARSQPLEAVKTQLDEEAQELSHHQAPEPEQTGEPEQDLYFFAILDAAGHSQISASVGTPGALGQLLDLVRARSRVPDAIRLPGWEYPVRLVSRAVGDGRTLLAGWVPHDDMELLESTRQLFIIMWILMVVLGFALSFYGLRRVLTRVDRIAETAAAISAHNLNQRIDDPGRNDEIAHLTLTFNGMLGRLQAAVGSLRAVADSTAHDLRSPLTSLRGTLESALSSDDVAAKDEKLAAGIEDVDRMAALVDAALDLAEADAGALSVTRKDVDLTTLAADMVDLFLPAAEEKGIRLIFRPGAALSINADPDLLRRALGNLLDNALMHLPAGTQVAVSVRRGDGEAVLAVVDDGPGFPAALRDRAFQRNVRRPGSPGRGLGLAIVRSIAEAHGGGVSLDQPPGGGSRVTIHLPFQDT
ncbi:MAG: HAMP domain-containing protein [Acidobacteria bacterium]|nr:HAMP domain-containing protein [Acidobacteriota bacterium]